MSHEVETMAFAHEVPWHGLGNNVRPDASVDEMLVASGLNWEVKKLPIFAEREAADGTKQRLRIPGRRVLIRDTDNKVMTIVGDDWKPFQNRDALGLFRDYVDAGAVSLETAGSLRNGRIIWALANLKHTFQAQRGDYVKGYLLLTSHHQVGTSISARTTSVRVVCANTMALAMRDSSAQIHYSQSHVREFDVAKAKASIETAHEQVSVAAKQAKLLTKLHLSDEDKVRFLAQFTTGDDPETDSSMDVNKPETWSKNLSQIIASVNSGPGADPNTGWGVLNGVLHWADHVAGRSNASRMFRSWVGDYSRLKNDVNAKLLELAA